MFSDKVNDKQLKKILNVQKTIKCLGFDDKVNVGSYGYKYVTLPKLRVELGKILEANELGFVQPTVVIDGKQALNTIIFDEEGTILTATTMLEIMNPGDPQSYGKSLTYARRYQLCALLGVVADEDDDVVITEDEIKNRVSGCLTLGALSTLFKRLDSTQQKEYKELFSEKRTELEGQKNQEKQDILNATTINIG